MPTPRVESLIARLEKGHRKTLEIFSSFGADQWAAIVYREPCEWNARDLLAHFASTEERLLELAQDVAGGGPGAPDGFDYDTLNAEEQERLKDRSPHQLLQMLDDARATTVRWVSALEDEQLDRVGSHPVLGQVTVEAMILAIYGHQLLHMRELRPALDSSAGPAEAPPPHLSDESQAGG